MPKKTERKRGLKYKIGTISQQSGLAVQTLREYADRGLLEADTNGETRYRYFDANAVNKASAIRRLRMMGFTLAEVTELISSASHSRYAQLLGQLRQRRQEQLDQLKEVIALLEEHQRQTDCFPQALYQGALVRSQGYYCLDYRKNGQLLCQSEAQRALLTQWMDQALYTRNYSPMPMAALEGAQVDHVIGLAIPEKYASHVPLTQPVYRRPPQRCALFCIRHDDGPALLGEGAQKVRRYMAENKLTVCGQPYFIGELPVFEAGEKVFYGWLFIPVEEACAGNEGPDGGSAGPEAGDVRPGGGNADPAERSEKTCGPMNDC